ncbi:MAG TPA: DUF4148 domain-containing protein [Trinickia sp.]|jgi:hypothetical protein|uniref:DUF4148 domain-containing protein n=1 Tax=Trinickia sp. TaxID=2571163 RepID=UPI002BFA21FE|nr:DUF4148 domain-containing protein [Trinickia sp.]HTI17357.1 DUF4148 domain-containing protein [Trinickia sp.]
MMKSLIKTVALSCALATPLFAVAQTSNQASAQTLTQTNNGPLTRAEVRADLIRLEQAGYRPSTKDIHYPADIQAAEAKVAASGETLASTSVGGVAEQSAAAGGAVSGGSEPPVVKSIYTGH